MVFDAAATTRNGRGRAVTTWNRTVGRCVEPVLEHRFHASLPEERSLLPGAWPSHPAAYHFTTAC
jgi:hypothetical protein